MAGPNQYAEMQKAFYESSAAISRYNNADRIDNVVGSYEQHNDWPDYDRFLMKFVTPALKDALALDFGCGPGRNIVKYSHLFRQLDGADIAEGNIANAMSNLKAHGMGVPNLFVTDGVSLGAAPSSEYDFIFSTITMQHICVHETRLSILRDMYRCLRKLGRISIQMGFGQSPGKAHYYDNIYDATTTNSGLDTMVEDPEYIETDLAKIGYGDVRYWIRPTGPGDSHPYWIFFTATK